MITELDILVVTTSYPLSEDSVSGVFVSRLVKELRNNSNITVLTPADQKNNRIIEVDNIRIVPFRYAPRYLQVLAHAPGGIPVAIKKNPLLNCLIPFFLFGMFVACLRHAHGKNVIHANWAICGVIAGLAGRLRKIPVITTLRGEDVTRADKSKLDEWIIKVCIHLSGKVIGVSQAIVDWLKLNHTYARDKFNLVENGVDENFLKLTAPVYTKNSLRMVTIGSLIPRKGIDVILHAMRELPQTTLTVIGDGQERVNLQNKVIELGLHSSVQFDGEVQSRHIPGYLEKNDVLILASYSEGRPNVILEAMAAGIPVVASKIAGVDELVVDGETGLMFPAGEQSELASCLKYFLNAPDKLKLMGTLGRKSIIERGLIWKETAKRYIDIYHSLSAVED